MNSLLVGYVGNIRVHRGCNVWEGPHSLDNQDLPHKKYLRWRTFFTAPNCTVNSAEGGCEVERGPMFLNGGDPARRKSTTMGVFMVGRCMTDKGKTK